MREVDFSFFAVIETHIVVFFLDVSQFPVPSFGSLKKTET